MKSGIEFIYFKSESFKAFKRTPTESIKRGGATHCIKHTVKYIGDLSSFWLTQIRLPILLIIKGNSIWKKKRKHFLVCS